MKPDSHLVIGGGLAGAALAVLLARQGHKIRVMEKQHTTQHKVCGEFLSTEALHYLKLLGVNPTALECVAIERMRIIYGRSSAEAPLPFSAQSLTRKTLDQAVLTLAEEAGASVMHGAEVTVLRSGDQGALISTRAHGEWASKRVFLATGKHELRQWPRLHPHPTSIGFKMIWKLSPSQQKALEETVELYLFEGGYAGLQPVEKGRANLCIALSQSAFTRLGKQWDDVLRHWQGACPLLAERLKGALPCWPKPLAIAGVPYGYLHKPLPDAPDYLYRLGDQMAVIPSFCGDGMSMALHTAFLAANATDAPTYHAQARADFQPSMRRARWASTALQWPFSRRLLMQGFQRWPETILPKIAATTRLSPHRWITL